MIFWWKPNVFWGFSGSTGALNNLQQVSMNNLVVTQYDSIAIGVITIHNSFDNNINITNCDSIYNGQSFYETGQYNFNYTNVFGCDSTINLNLTINKSSFTSQVLNFVIVMSGTIRPILTAAYILLQLKIFMVVTRFLKLI